MEFSAALLMIFHFGTPLVYYAYLKRVAGRPLGIRFNEDHRPSVAVVVPTCNESSTIMQRLDNIKQQEYPKELVQVIVVDSSSDGTADIVDKWSGVNRESSLELIRETHNRGKLHALDIAIRRIPPSCEIVVFTDADALWEPQALRKTVRYFADPNVGSLTASIRYMGTKDQLLENQYRDHYNFVHVAESRVHSTPIHNGPFMAIRWNLISEVGLPMFEGSDDSAFGSFIALRGYRALCVEDVTVEEPFRGNQALKKVRRAQHLLLILKQIKKYTKKKGLYRKSSFERIWKIEWWLTIINPWLLLTCTMILLFDLVFFKSITSLMLLTVGLAFLAIAPFRMWVLQQLCLILATIRNLWTKETIWRK